MRIARAAHQVPVHARERAIDAFFLADVFDRVDRHAVAVRSQLRALFAVQVFEFEVAVVERIAQVAGGARGLAAVQVVFFEDDDIVASARQVPRGGQAGDAGPHDAGPCMRVCGQWRENRRVVHRHPERTTGPVFLERSISHCAPALRVVASLEPAW